MDTEYSKDFAENLDLAKLMLMRKPPFAFLSSLLYQFNIEENRQTQTIAFDGIEKKLYVNPTWFNELSHEHQATSIAHSIMGYALQHDIRLGNRDPNRFQKASDHVINNILEDSGFEIPEDALNDSKYKGKSVDNVYRLIEEEEKNDQDNNDDNQNNQNNDGDSSGNNDNSGGQDSGSNPNPLSNDLTFKSPTVHQQNQRNTDLVNADTADKISNPNKSHGALGDALDDMFENIKKGSLDWRTILAEHMEDLSRGDRSYDRLDRRMLTMGLYAPDMQSINEINKVAVAFDVSGSVSREEITAFLREIQNIKESLNPEVLQIMTFNHKIVEKITFEQNEEIKDVKMKTGGGTDLAPVFKYYSEPKNEPTFLIVFSDLCCSQIKKIPKYEVTWVCINNPEAKVKFGKLIHTTSEEFTESN